MNPSIPASQLVTVLPGVVGTGGNPLALNAFFLSKNRKLPSEQVSSFPSYQAVSDYFGPDSTEAALAQFEREAGNVVDVSICRCCAWRMASREQKFIDACANSGVESFGRHRIGGRIVHRNRHRLVAGCHCGYRLYLRWRCVDRDRRPDRHNHCAASERHHGRGRHV